MADSSILGGRLPQLAFDATIARDSAHVKASGSFADFDPAVASGKPELKGKVGGTPAPDPTVDPVSRTVRRASVHAAGQSNELVKDAADILCQDLTRKRTGQRPTDKYFRAVTKLGEAVESGGFAAIAGVEPGEILMKY